MYFNFADKVSGRIFFNALALDNISVSLSLVLGEINDHEDDLMISLSVVENNLLVGDS